MEAAFVVVFALLAGLGFWSARWTMLIAPVLVWPAFYSAIDAGLIGSGLGDSWLLVASLVTISSLLATAAAVALGKLLVHRRAGRPPERSN